MKVPSDSAKAMKELDPDLHMGAAVTAPPRLDGNPPPEVIEAFVAEAKSEGCTCDPDIAIHKSKVGGGAIGLMHKGDCPLLQELDAKRAAESQPKGNDATAD